MGPPQDDVAHDGLAGGVVGGPHHSRLGHRWVVNEGRLHFGGRNAVAGHVHHVVYPT